MPPGNIDIDIGICHNRSIGFAIVITVAKCNDVPIHNGPSVEYQPFARNDVTICIR